MLQLWIEHRTFRSSVWRSPNWAIEAAQDCVDVKFIIIKNKKSVAKNGGKILMCRREWCHLVPPSQSTVLDGQTKCIVGLQKYCHSSILLRRITAGHHLTTYLLTYHLHLIIILCRPWRKRRQWQSLAARRRRRPHQHQTPPLWTPHQALIPEACYWRRRGAK